MSEHHLPDSAPHSPDPDTSPNAASLPPDPLLDGGSYIDPGRNDSGAETPQHQPSGNPEFKPGVVIAAEPISMYLPEEPTAESAPRSVRRRNPEEMSKRPTWLPEDWKIDLKVRSSGATAGLIDRYYVAPSGQRRFRSKNEVLHFLETGNKPKRKLTSDTDTGPSASPASEKPKKTATREKPKKSATSEKPKKPATKRKKSEALNSDIKHPAQVNGV